MAKVYLKDNWSEQFIFGDKTPGVFTGRRHEIDLLKSILKGNDSSSILVSGIRGTGKTTFIHKTLSEIQEEKISPFFVNIGHTLSGEDIQKKKKLILVSIIRSLYLVNKDKELEVLYHQGIGRTYMENSDESNTNDSKEISLNVEGTFSTSVPTGLAMIGALIIGSSGVSDWNSWIKLILSIIGTILMLFSYKWKTVTETISNLKNKTSIDDSTDLLEIKFEQWLEKNFQNGNKIVIVIDELDKIEINKAMETIKEYKNLFTQSKSHFIFIASQEAYDKTLQNRKGTDVDSYFPTFFTHTIYLPLPTSQDLKSYLDEILINKEISFDIKMKSYFLFKSKNDYFELKRLLGDISQFDSNGIYIDTDLVKDEDLQFNNIAKLYPDIDTWHIGRYNGKFKKNWKDNSIMQDEIFTFLNDYLDQVIHDASIVSVNIENLISDLDTWGYIEKTEKYYNWIYAVKRLDASSLKEIDIKFNEAFNKIIKIVNDIDDLPNIIRGLTDFEIYEEILEGHDAIGVTGVSIYEPIYRKYEQLYKKLNDKFGRKGISIKETRSAEEVISQQIINIQNRYFEIVRNISTQTLDNSINKSQPLQNVANLFSSIPNFYNTFNQFDNSVFYKSDSTKILLLVKDFDNLEDIKEILKNLELQKNILVINLKKGGIRGLEFGQIENLGGKRRKMSKVDNFITYTISDIRDLEKPLSRILNHFSN